MKQLQALSQISKMSGRTYISILHRQLEEEKAARLRLEEELEELRRVSEEINENLSKLYQEQQQFK